MDSSDLDGFLEDNKDSNNVTFKFDEEDKEEEDNFLVMHDNNNPMPEIQNIVIVSHVPDDQDSISSIEIKETSGKGE